MLSGGLFGGKDDRAACLFLIGAWSSSSCSIAGVHLRRQCPCCGAAKHTNPNSAAGKQQTSERSKNIFLRRLNSRLARESYPLCVSRILLTQALAAPACPAKLLCCNGPYVQCWLKQRSAVSHFGWIFLGVAILVPDQHRCSYGDGKPCSWCSRGRQGQVSASSCALVVLVCGFSQSAAGGWVLGRHIKGKYDKAAGCCHPGGVSGKACLQVCVGRRGRLGLVVWHWLSSWPQLYVFSCQEESFGATCNFCFFLSLVLEHPPSSQTSTFQATPVS